MGRPKELITEELVERAKRRLGEIKEHKIALRLQAIISAGKYPISQVARIFGVSRQSVRLWAWRFIRGDVEGLRDKKKGHRRSKLGEEEQAEVVRWLRESIDSRGVPTHWTVEKLRREIEKVFGVKMGKTPVWRLIRLMGFRHKSTRPRHKKADPQKEEEFKKNSGQD